MDSKKRKSGSAGVREHLNRMEEMNRLWEGELLTFRWQSE